MQRHLFVMLLAMMGCGEQPAETDALDTEIDDDPSAADVEVTWEFMVSDLPSDVPIAGAQFTVGSETYTSDAAGIVRLVVTGESYVQADMTATGFPNVHFYRFIGPQDWYSERMIPSNTGLETLADALGVVPDATKGKVVAINTLNCHPGDPRSACSFLAGVLVEIDSDYDLTLVDDATQMSGFSVGDTSIDAAVSFINVTPGPVRVTLTPPPGYRCDHIPPSVEVIANEYHEVTAHCGPQ
jgi:hypothetical protein